VLIRHLGALAQALGGAELEVEDWLGSRDLAEVIRTAYDPESLVLLAPGSDPELAGPVYAEARPGCYVHDRAASAAYWVQAGPGRRRGAPCWRRCSPMGVTGARSG
jgi:hypothetical protein